MPRNMSFALTTGQFINKTKDVTRRLGWDFLKPGDLIWGVKKAMGLRKGEKIERLGLIEIVSTTAEPLSAISKEDVIREGFPDLDSEQFIDFFVKEYKISPDTIVNRFEFRHIDILTILDGEKEIGSIDLKSMLDTGSIPQTFEEIMNAKPSTGEKI